MKMVRAARAPSQAVPGQSQIGVMMTSTIGGGGDVGNGGDDLNNIVKTSSRQDNGTTGEKSKTNGSPDGTPKGLDQHDAHHS